MIANVLRSIGGIGLYGVVSILLFFTVFSGALIWTLSRRRPLMDAMAALPLADDSAPETANVLTRHE